MKRPSFFVILILITFLITGCTVFQSKPSTKIEKIKVQLLPYFSYAPLYIAQAEGYYAEQGLEVEFVQLHGENAFVALSTGEIDVAATTLISSFLSAIYQGEVLKIVADKGYVSPTGCAVNGLLARRTLIDNGEVSEIKDLKGRNVSYDDAAIQAYFLDKLLNTAGLSLADINIINLDSPPMIPEAFKTGAMDFAVESEPWLTRNLNSGYSVLWKDYKENFPNLQFGIVFYGPNLLEKNPEIGKRFMVAYLKAVRLYNQGKTDHNIELMKAFTSVEEDLLKQVCWPTMRDDLMINVQSVLDFQDWSITKNYLDGPLTVEQFWDPTFAEYALDALK